MQGVPAVVVPPGVVLEAPPVVDAVPGADGAALPAVVDGLDPAVDPGIVAHGVPTVDPFVPAGAPPVPLDVPGVAPGVVVVPGIGGGWVGVLVLDWGTVVPACGVAVPAPGVVLPALGVAGPAAGVAVPAGGVAVVAGGVAVPAGGTAAPGVEVCPAEPPEVGALPAGAVCATIQLAHASSIDKTKNLKPDISILPYEFVMSAA